MERLERLTGQLDDRVYDLGEALSAEQKAWAEAEKKAQHAHEELQRTMESRFRDLEVGSLHVEAMGAAWILCGILLGAQAD